MNESIDLLRNLAGAAMVASIAVILAYLIAGMFIAEKKAVYFGSGSHREMLLIIAIRNYMATLAPSLCCDCEFVLEHEQATKNKCRFNVTIRFKHDSVCHCNDEKAVYLVDVSDSTEVQIVKPVNDAEIEKYKI